eukprot:TRINITY_DN32415_c0_g1_i1.p1 TRINITY_DN32415_c0_g1~~TRINITY_DN32415_c0_g1_i1.p1  ORF type:complete len:733 (+),score=109.15 TRINITY_DN32415_c0_g1_i1:239-2200(+)
MALANLLTILLVSTFVDWKFTTLQFVVDSKGVFFGICTLVSIDMGFAALCVCLIFGIAPAAGSSGAPENKGWLNGNLLPGFFTFRNLIVRAFGVVLSNAAGFPVGREGPSVTMGSNIAFLVTGVLAKPWVSEHVSVDAAGSVCPPVLVVDEERLAHAQRIAGTVGGACAMAMIFDAPIGGILYMFEEITAISWHMELTFRCVAGTTVCTMLSYLLLDLMQSRMKAFVIYEWAPQEYTWSFNDVPYFLLVAVAMGVFSAVHTKLSLWVSATRQRVHERLWQPWGKMADAVLYSAICAITYSTVSLLATCEPFFKDGSESLTHYVRYNCEEGAYNPVASIVLTTTEGAVKRLFSKRNSGDLFGTNIVLAFLAYTTINMGMTGISVPSGNFTGTMLIGGLAGRLTGSLARSSQPHLAASGVYAMAGSAAMLCGFKQISMSVVTFIVEAGYDLSLTGPVMMSVVVSLLVNRLFIRRGFDEEQIARKKVPFLPAELPKSMEQVVALDLCDLLPRGALLAPEVRVNDVRYALHQAEMYDFPIVEGTTCLGFTTRQRLEAALTARSFAGNSTLPVTKFMDPVPYTVLENTKAQSFYMLFSKGGSRVVAVTSETGVFRGMISRRHLISATRDCEEHEMQTSKSGYQDQDGVFHFDEEMHVF